MPTGAAQAEVVDSAVCKSLVVAGAWESRGCQTATLWVVVGRIAAESSEAASCNLHHSTARRRDGVEAAAGLVDTHADPEEADHLTEAGREWVLGNRVVVVVAAVFSDLCYLQDCQDFSVEAAAQRQEQAPAEARNQIAHTQRHHMHCHRTSPRPAPWAAEGESTVAEAAVVRHSHLHLWAHWRPDAAVSSAADLEGVLDQDRKDLSVAAAVSVLRAHSRSLEDRRGHGIDSSLSTRVKGGTLRGPGKDESNGNERLE